MDAAKLAILHDHYRDSCSVMQAQRSTRDRHFYFVLALLAVALFDIATPKGFAEVVAGVVQSQLGMRNVPDLAYLRSLLWFLVFGVTLRYGQLSLNIERQYAYIHRLESAIAGHLEGVFGREGVAYLTGYPLYLRLAHRLYAYVFPLLLGCVAVVWTYHRLPDQYTSWPLSVWFDVTVTVTMLVMLSVYVCELRAMDQARASSKKH